MLDGDQIVYVVRVPSTPVMTVAINLGGRMPAHATSMGKVLRAALPEGELSAYLERATLTRFLPRTVTDPERLREQLAEIRATGYAVVDRELEEGLVAIAAPVRGRNRGAIGATNLFTTVLRHSVESVRAELPEPLLRTARAIEANLVGVG